MSDLIVIAFKDEHQADDLLLMLRKMQREHLVGAAAGAAGGALSDVGINVDFIKDDRLDHHAGLFSTLHLGSEGHARQGPRGTSTLRGDGVEEFPDP